MIDVVNYRSLPKKIKVNLSRNEIILFFCNWRLGAPRVEQTSSACVTEKGFIASGGDYVSSREEYKGRQYG